MGITSVLLKSGTQFSTIPNPQDFLTLGPERWYEVDALVQDRVFIEDPTKVSDQPGIKVGTYITTSNKFISEFTSESFCKLTFGGGNVFGNIFGSTPGGGNIFSPSGVTGLPTIPGISIPGLGQANQIVGLVNQTIGTFNVVNNVYKNVFGSEITSVTEISSLVNGVGTEIASIGKSIGNVIFGGGGPSFLDT